MNIIITGGTLTIMIGGILNIIAQCQELGIKPLNNDPVLILQNSKCKIQTGTTKLIHPINLTDIEQTMEIVSTLAYKKITNPLTKIVKQKLQELYTNFHQIKPTSTIRRKRWDKLGTAWKWIAGNPDAQDLRIINSSMNDLINENNRQYQVNNQVNLKLQTLTNTVNEIVENSYSNKVVLNEVETLITILNIDTINKILLDIQDAIILSKTFTVNTRILSLKEITTIRLLLEEQGIKVDLPDEAINLVTPKIAVSKDTLLYILHVPQLEPEEADIIQIFPLNNDNVVIKNYPNYLIKLRKTLYISDKPSEYVQRHAFIKEFTDSCIQPLIWGTHAHCATKTEYHTETKLIAENTILITNAKNQTISSTCGPNNRNLTGNFIITFSNCSVVFDNLTFSSKEIKSEAKLMQTALYNIRMEHWLQNELNISVIDNQTMTNRKLLHHVSLKQFNSDIQIWSLFGGLSVTTIISITLIFIYLRRTVNEIWQKISRSRKRKQKPSDANPKEVQRAKEYHTDKLSAEDDTFSPPGGVTPSPTADP